MLNREIPFRPRLEGDFRIRFYNAVSRITENTTLADIENIADEEIKWVTSECTFNLDQRKKYRAVWFLFRDLIHASWKALYRDGVLYMNLPILNGNSTHDGSAPEVKQLLRSWMSESRHERLLTFIDFIKHMEARNSAGHDISELIADGPELANRIEQAHAGRISIKQAVQPYAVYAVKIKNEIILLNLSQANRIIEEALHKRRFSFLGLRRQIVREKKIGGYKSDLYIEDTKTIIEIKSILSFQKAALFPTVYSERGIKQLAQLSTLLDEGFKVCYLFVSFSHHVREIQINNGIEEYARLLNVCLEKGMTVYGITLKMKDGCPLIHSTIPVLVG